MMTFSYTAQRLCRCHLLELRNNPLTWDPDCPVCQERRYSWPAELVEGGNMSTTRIVLESSWLAPTEEILKRMWDSGLREVALLAKDGRERLLSVHNVCGTNPFGGRRWAIHQGPDGYTLAGLLEWIGDGKVVDYEPAADQPGQEVER